jgi:hypothetical protein
MVSVTELDDYGFYVYGFRVNVMVLVLLPSLVVYVFCLLSILVLKKNRPAYVGLVSLLSLDKSRPVPSLLHYTKLHYHRIYITINRRIIYNHSFKRIQHYP